MFERELAQREQEHRLRRLHTIDGAQGPSVTLDGRNVLLLSSNDYLGLAGHPAVAKSVADAAERYGSGAGASRLVSGNMTLHENLESGLAAFKNTEAAILFNSGYAANTAVIPSIAEKGDVIFSDELNHASIIDGCRLSRAETFIYRHRDLDHLEQVLRANGKSRRKLIVTDGVFSMDGDIAPLPALAALSERYDALLMVDDAHGTGVLGPSGRGTAEHFTLTGRVAIQMGTLGKALGSFGAYVAGDRGLVRYLQNTCRSYIFSTALPPPVCAASLEALAIVDREPWRRTQLWRNRRRLAEGLAALGIGTAPSETPILPVVIGDDRKALAASRRLLDLGVYAPAIRPPSVPEGSARIRTTVIATHSDGDIDRALEMFRQLRDEGYLS